MIDLRSEVQSILESIAHTCYQYPPEFSILPMISFWDSDHRAEAFQDNQSTGEVVEFTIDCWERVDPVTGEFKEIHFDVDMKMRQAGYLRTMFVNQYEEDTKIYHISMKFIKVEEDDVNE